MKIKINDSKLNHWEKKCLKELSMVLQIECGNTGIPILTRKSGKGISVEYTGERLNLAYSQKNQFSRCFSLAVEAVLSGKAVKYEEASVYDHLEIMVDCARNAVPTVATLSQLFRYSALMGYTGVQLYLEDLFELDGYPYFGYLRGRYSAMEIRALDRCAQNLGLELIPCVQTLSHYKNFLKWPACKEIKDVPDTLLIDEEKTYELIEAIFQFMSQNIKSRRINIGMDEAEDLGLGQYRQIHGIPDQSKLMLRHLKRVLQIADKYGYSSMMWSDMFFKLSGGEYYTSQNVTVSEEIPDNVTFIYWDYYSSDQSHYDQMLKKHFMLSKKVAFAGCTWKWSGFAPHTQFTQDVTLPAHRACVENGVKDIIVTAWGDNGAECPLFSVLPSMQLWAELSYRGDKALSGIETRFATCTEGDYRHFMELDLSVRPHIALENLRENAQKYIFYSDILCGIFDQHIDADRYERHYKNCADRLGQIACSTPQWGYLFHVEEMFCRVLAQKCRAGIDLRTAYRSGDLVLLRKYAQDILPVLSQNITSFLLEYRTLWFRENKTFGFDVIELRIGALLQRIESAIWRLEAYLNGKLSEIEELEQEILPYIPERNGSPIYVGSWDKIVSASNFIGI